MRNIFKFACAALVSVSLMTSCIEEVDPTSVATDNQILGSSQSQRALVNGIAGYMNFYDGGWADRHYAYAYSSIGLMRDLMCNDMASPAAYYEWYDAWFTNQYLGQDYIYAQYIWTYLSRLAFTINNVVDVLQPTTPQMKQWLGVAHAYRAMIRLEMGQMYEFKANPYTESVNKGVNLVGLTIPDLRDGMTEEETRNNPRITKAELLEDIKADLALAIEYLEGYVPEQVAFPSQAVAYGLKARMHLWEEKYAEAKEAAQMAISLSGCTPLTEAEWTDTKTGFNSFDSNNSWMWGTRLTSESNLVKTSLLNFTSWIATETNYGYAGINGGGTYRMADAKFYQRISDNDFRKKSWIPTNPERVEVDLIDGFVLEDMPPLATIKFRPAQGEPSDYLIASAADYPLMRVEEMHLIVAECDARSGDASTITNFMTTYRNPTYTCLATTPETILEEVIFQKRVELWGEGRIFFDYKRLELPINRYYEGTNHHQESQFNVFDGLAPWFNLSAVRTEYENNNAFVNNPDPSGTVGLKDEDGIK